MGDRKSSGIGQGTINEMLKNSKLIKGALENLNGTIAKFGMVGEDNATDTMQKVEQEYEDLQKKTKEPIQISIEDKDIFDSDRVSSRIAEIKTKLERSLEKINGGDKLSKKQAEMYIREYLELERYMDRMQGQVETRFSDMYKNIVESIKAGNNGSIIELLSTSDFKELTQGVNSGFAKVAKQSFERNWNAARRSLSKEANAGNAEEQAQYVQSIKDQINSLSQEAENLRNTMSQLFYTEVDKDGTIEYFDEELQKMEDVRKKANELRSALSEIEVPRGNSDLKDSINESLQVLSGVQRDSSGRKDTLQAARNERQQRIQEEAAELERAAQRRADAVKALIIGDSNYEEFGNQRMLDSAMEEARQAEDNASAIQEIYQRVSQKLLEAKQQKDLAEQQRQQLEESREKTRRNRQRLDEFFEEIADGDSKKLRQYRSDYADYYNKLINPEEDIDDIIAAISAKLGLLRSGGTGGGTGTVTGTGFTDSFEAQMEEDGEKARETGRQAREAWEEAEKEYESIGDIKERIRQEYQENRTTIHNDSDYYKANPVGEDDINDSKNRLSELTRILENLQEKREDYQRDLESAQKEYSRYSSEKDDYGVESYASNIEENYKKILKYNDLISYIQKELNSELTNFKLGDTWGTQEINFLIETLKQLVREIQKVSSALGTIDDESGISSLLSQFKDFGETIDSIFNTDNIEEFKDSIQGLSTILERISESIGVIGEGTNRSARNNKKSIRQMVQEGNKITKDKKFGLDFNIKEDSSLEAEQMKAQAEIRWKSERERYKVALDKLKKTASDVMGMDDGEYALFSGLLNSNNAIANRYQGDLSGVFGSAVISNMQNPEEVVQRIMDFFSIVNSTIEQYRELIPEKTAIKKNMKTGDTGVAVKELQRKLKLQADTLGDLYDIDISGKFDDETKNAVMDFQKRFNIKGTIGEVNQVFMDTLDGLFDAVRNPLLEEISKISLPSDNMKNLNKVMSEIYDVARAPGEKKSAMEKLADTLKGLGVTPDIEGQSLENYQFEQTINDLKKSFIGLQTIVKNGFGLTEIEGEEGKFTSFLSELVSKMEEVRKSAGEMASSLSGALKEIGGADGDNLSKRIQDQISSGNPYEIEIEPKNTLVKAIEEMLNGSDFEIDIKANMNGKDSPEELITQMVGADVLTRAAGGNLRERAMLFNSQTGYHTNPFMVGDAHNVSSQINQVIMDSATEAVDTYIHTHPSLFPGFSIAQNVDGILEGDYKAMYQLYKEKGINTQINAAQNGVAIFDAKSFFEKYGNLFEEDQIDNTMTQLSDAYNSSIKDIIESAKKLSDIFRDIDGFNVPLDKMLDSDVFTDVGKSSSFKDLISKIWSNSFGKFDSNMFTQGLFQYIDTLPSDYNKTFNQVVREYLAKSFSDFGIDESEIKSYIEDSGFVKSIKDVQSSWMSNILSSDQFAPKILQQIAPEVFKKALHIEDFSSYIDYQSIEQFKRNSNTFGGRTDPYNGIVNSASAAANAKNDFTNANKEAKESVAPTVDALDKENIEFHDIADAAEDAARGKSEFADENHNVADTSNQQIDQQLNGVSEQEQMVADQAKQIATAFGENLGLAKNTVDELTKSIIEMVNVLSSGNYEDPVSNILSILSKDSKLLKNVDFSDGNEAKDIRKYLKGQKIKILPEYKQESGDDWDRHRKMLGFNIMQQNGADLSEVVSQMQNQGIGTSINLDQPNVNIWNDLISILEDADQEAKELIADFLKVNNVDIDDFASQIESLVKIINPDYNGFTSSLFDGDESPISSGTTALLEQEQAAGQAGQQMGEQIADGAEKANTALTELFQKFTIGNIESLNIGELLGYGDVKASDIYKDLQPVYDIVRKITRGDISKGDNKITIPTSNIDGEPITDDQLQKIERYKTILHALGYEIGELDNNHKISSLSAEIIPTENAIKNIDEVINALIKLNAIKGSMPNETPVSSSEEEVATAAADAHKKAAAAAEEHAAAAREANNEEANTQPSPIDERNDFIQRSKQIFDEFGMSQHDIPVEWQAFLNNIANDGMKADDALEALRATLDAIGDQKPPEYFGGEEANKSNDSIYIKQDVNDYDDEDYSYTEWLGYAQQRLVKRKRRYDEDGTPAEDEFGNPLYDESSKTFTNFKQIEQEVINVDKVILKLWADLEKGEELHKPTKAIRELLAYAGDYSRELTQELDKYYQEAGYFPGDKQVQDFMKRRKQSSLQVSANLQRSADEEAYKEQQKLNKAIEDTNALIEKQQGNLDSLKRKYVSGAGVEFSEKDKDRLIKQEQEIQKIFDRIRGRKTTKTEKEEIDNALKKYRDIAQESVKHQKAATKLDADRPDVARDRLIADIDDLLGKMKDSGADTSKQQERLRGILKLLQDQFDLVSDPASWIKQRGQDYKKVREENRAIQNEYEREEKSTNRYAELTMKKARETNLEADEQQELDQLTQRYEILNGLKEAGFQLSSNELAIIERVAQADKAAMEERIRLQEELQESIKEYDYEQERKAAIEKDEQDRKGMKEQDIANQDSLKQAQKALTDYENAVKNLVKAQTEFDLGDQKDPKIVKNLEDAKHAVEETKYALMGLAKVFDEEFVDKDVKNEAKNRLAEALRLERNPALSEDYRSALYKQNKKEEEARQKEAAAQQKLSDKEQVAQIRNTYKENLDVIKQYHEALKELNFLEEKSKIDPSVKGTERFKELTEQVAKLKEEAKEAMDVIDQLQMEGVLRDGQHTNAKTMYDNAGTLKATQQDQLNDLMNRKLRSDLFSQINEQLDIIKNAYDLQTRKNLSDTAQLRGGSTGENIQKLTDECKEAADAAKDAKQEIENLLSVSGDILGADEIEAITKRTNREFDKSKRGSASSARSLSNARKAQYSQEVRTELEEYNKAMQEYSSLYEKSITGTLTVDENERMANSLKTIIKLEENWNEEKAKNVKLTERQKDLRDMLDNASKQYGDDGKHDDNYTKEMLETNVLQDRAVSQYDALMRKLTKMYDQSTWRKGGWDDEVSGLIAELKTYNPNDVFDQTSLNKFIESLQEIKAKAQDVSKSIDFRPVKETWQTKTTSGLQKWMDQNKIAAKKYEDDINQIFEDIKKVVTEGEAADIENRINKIQGEAAEKGLLGKSLGDRFKDQFKNTMTSLATYYLSFQDFIRYGRQAISIITELDTQLTEMRKVSDESLQTLQDYQLETFDIASRVGTTAAQIQSSTADWMRLGETLSEAKKSAEYSTLLLNVSEFSDINSATESLVAMSQAYQDIDKLDIIDKLNNIGNNFSISTSDLASSLQLSAGTLKVAGNSLDEAVALTVAGNQVLQDPQKVGQSLRTISLRLTGTSVEDMQEAGEEIDGLITTQSKLRKTIMDITKVSSNGFKGFDILNESGNYKSTYEMLKGIAEVWKEIGEEDKKMGSNRQSLLLETIAGKTRAAAAASILDNFETLQDVYEASLNSQGSAQNELDKYLDSINGKVAQFQNRLQELASVTIDSSWIKAIVDFGSEALKIVTALSKQFGGLNLIAGGAIGAFLQFNGKGLLNFDKSLGKNVFNKDNAFSNIISGFKNAFTKQSFGDDILDSIFSGMDKTDKIYDKVAENANKVKMPDNFVNWFNGLEDADKKAATLGDALEATGLKTLSLSNAFKTLGKIGGTVLSTIGSMAITMVAMFAFEAAIKGIYNLIHAEEIAIEKGKEARQAIQDINKQYDEKQDYVDKNTERYNELRKGVDISETGGVQNKSLSNEEFNEFLSINNQLANLFPSLVSGYDAQGNAMLTLSTNADDATSSLNRLLEQERQIADYKIGEQLNDATTGFITRYKQLQKDIKEQDKIIEAGQELQKTVDQKIPEDAKIDLSKFGVDISNREMRFSYDVDSDIEREFATRLQNIYAEAAKDVGGVDWSASDLTSGNIVGALVGITDEQAAKIEENFKAAIQKLDISDIPEEVMDAMSVKNMDISEIKADWNGLVPSILSQLSLYEDYQKLGDLKIGEQLQNIIANDISNMSSYFDNFEDIFGEGAWKEFGDNTRGFVREHFLDPIANSLKDSDGNFDKIKVDALNKLVEFDGSKLTNEEYKDQVNNIVSSITKDTEIQKQIKVILGFQYLDENGNNHWNVTKQRDELYEALGGFVGEPDEKGRKEHHTKVGMSIGWDKFASLSQEDLNAIEYAQSNMGVDLSTIDTWEQLTKKIEEAKKAMEETVNIKPDGTLSDIFNNESYQSNVEGYEKKLSSLTSALETLRTEGNLTSEQMRDLQEEFPSLTDFTTDELQKAGTKYLSDWISEFKSGWTDFSDEGQKQLDTYLANFTASYRKIAVSEQDALAEVRESFITAPADDNIERMAQYEEFNDKLNALKAEYGEDLNWNIVLALKDQFSGDAQSLIDKYKDYRIIWNIELKKEDIQREIDNLISQRDVNSSRQSRNSSLGLSMTTQDYKNDNSISRQLIQYYEEQRKMAIEEIEKSYTNEKGELNLDDIGQSLINQQNAQYDKLIYDEQTKMIENNNAIKQLPLTQIQNARDEIARTIDSINTEISLNEANGFQATESQYNSLIEQTQLDNEKLQEEEKLLKEQADIMQRLADNDQIIDLENNANWKELQANMAENAKAQTENEKNIINYEKSIRQLPLTRLQNQRAQLTRNTTASNKIITDKRNRGLEVSEGEYLNALRDTAIERGNLFDQRSQIQGQIDDMIAAQEAMIEASGGAYDALDVLANNTEFQGLQSDLDSVNNEIYSMDEAIIQLNNDMNNIKMDKLKAEFSNLERDMDNIQRNLDDTKTENTAKDYVQAISKNFEQQANLREQIAEKQRQAFVDENGSRFISDLPETSEVYQTWASELAELESQLYNTTSANDAFVESLLSLPVTKIDEAIQDYQRELENLEAKQNVNAAKGVSMSEEDYEKNIATQRRINGKYLAGARLNSLLASTYEQAGDKGRQKQFEQAAHEDMQSYYSGIAETINMEKAKREIPVTIDQQYLDNLQREGEILQSTFDQLESQGKEITEKSYSGILGNLDEQIAKQKEVANGWLVLRDSISMTNKDGSLNTNWVEYDQNYTNALTALDGLNARQIELNEAVAALPLTNLQNELSDLEAEASSVQELMNFNEARGLKTSVKQYEKLMKNSKDQVKNLRNQNVELRNQQKNLDKNSSKYREINNQINSNRNAIRQAQQDILGYQDQIRMYELTDAQTLLSNLQTALSENASATGLTVESIEALKKSFSDLDGVDTSAIFYRTADGVKLDTNAIADLIDRENELKNASFEEKINAQRKAIEDYQKTLGEGVSNDHLRQMQDELIDLMNLQSQYFAQYQQELEQLNSHGMIALADQTENAGDRYRKGKDYMKSAHELWDTGRTGIDDFKERAAYFDYYGRTDAKTFKENYDKYNKYYTDDASGLKLFYDNLVKLGVAAKDAEGKYSLIISDADEAAKRVGMSVEAYSDYMKLSKEYGGDFTFVTSIEDGNEQLSGLNGELRVAQKELIDLVQAGADADVIAQKNKEIQELKSNIQDVTAATEGYRESEEKSYKTQLPNLEKTWKHMKEFRDAAIKDDDIEGQRFWEQQMEQLAHDYDLKLKPNYEFDQDGFEQQMEEAFPNGYKEFELQTKFNIKPEEITQANNTLQRFFKGNKANMEQAVKDSGILDYSLEDLLSINHSDGAWSAGEAELEAFADKLGVSYDQCNALLMALSELGLIDIEPGVETGQVEEATDKVDKLDQKAETPTEKVLTIHEKRLTDSVNMDGQHIAQSSAAARAENNKEVDMSGQHIAQSSAAARARNNATVTAEKQEIYNNRADEQAPLIDSVKSSAQDIVNAIVDAPNKVGEAVANAIDKLNREENEVVETNKANIPMENQHVSQSSASSRAQNQSASKQVNTTSSTGGFLSQVYQAFVELIPNTDKIDEQNYDQDGTVNLDVNDDSVEEKKSEIESNPITQAVNVVTNFIGGLFGGNKEEQPEQVESTETTTIEFKPGSTDEVKGAIDEIINYAQDNPAKIPIDGENDDAKTSADEAKNYADGLSGEITINGYNQPAISSAVSAVNEINAKEAEIKVKANTQSLVGSINSALSTQTFTAKVVANITGTVMNVRTTGGDNTSSGDARLDRLRYTGTLLSNARATGTLKDFDDYIIGGKAHASGDVTIPQDEDSLVNELGTESIIRDGIWRLIPGGMHVEHLKKGDIVLNHLQTRDLIEDGKAFGNGKLIGNAFAKGTAFNGMPAHGPGGEAGGIDFNKISGDNNGVKKDSGTGASDGAINNNTDALKDNTDSNNNSTQETETALDKFKKWADSLFDWIEVRMERLQHSIDKSTAQAELAKNYYDKNSKIEDAMKVLTGDMSKITDAKTTIKEEQKAAQKAGVNLKKPKTKFGNIDMNDRQEITWNNRTLNKNKKALQSLDPDAKKNWKQYKKDIKGSTSTVFGGSSEYKGVEIAYSPILQTEKGPELLTQKTLDDYINGLIQKNGGKVDSKLIALDKEGITKDGKTIKGLIADVGKTARKTGEQMHYVGKFGSIQMAKDEKNDLSGKIVQDEQGARRYYRQADKVQDRAISDKILSTEKINELVGLIKNGKIDIAEYEATQIDQKNQKNGNNSKEENPVTDFIAAYKEWYDKAQAMELQYYEDRQSLIEMEQTQLDNITEEFDSRTGLTEAKQSTYSARKELAVAGGTSVRSKSIEKNVMNQYNLQEKLIDQLNREASIYQDEMVDAAKNFGKDSNEYRQAQIQYEEIQQKAIEAETRRIQILKEYQQERLDAIENRYENRINYAESVKASSESLTSLYRTQGKKENGKEIKDTYKTQIAQQEKVTKLLNAEMEKYAVELERAKNVFGENSDEYRAALTTFEGMRKAVNESQEATIQLNRDMRELSATVEGFIIQRFRNLGDKMSSVVDLIAKRGKRKTEPDSGLQESDFTKQIANNNSMIPHYQKQIRIWKEQQQGMDIDSDEYMKYAGYIADAEQAVYGLYSQNEDLAQQLRDFRWTPFHELSDSIDDAIGDYDHLISLMNSESFFDDFGDGYKLTIDGLSALALYGEQIDANERKIALYEEGLKTLNKEYKNRTISEEQYTQQSREFKGVIQSSASAIKQEREQIIALYKTQMTNEANALKKNIDAYKELLERKRSYYDYDRQLSDKNKNIQMLERELRALEGVAGAEAAAERAKIEADLYEAKRDRDDTVQEHTYNLRTQGLDDLEKDIDETLDRNLRAVEANASVQDQVVSDMLGKVLLNYGTAYQGTGGINEVIGSAGTKTTETTTKQTEDNNKMLNETRKKYATDVQLMKNELDSLMAKNAANNTEQYKATDKMLTDTKTDYNDVYSNIQGLITDTGTKVGSTAEESMTNMKDTIFTAMKTTEEGIDDWIEKNKDKGFTIKTELVTGNEGQTTAWRKDAQLQGNSGGSTGGTKSASGGGTKGGSAGGGTKAGANAGGGAKKDTKNAVNTNGSDDDNISAARARLDQDKANNNTTVASNTKSIKEVLDSLKSRSKTITEAEKKAHSGLWEYVAKNYGKSITGKGIIELADALGVYVSATSRKANKPTSVEKITVLDALKRNKKGYAKGTLGTKKDELNWTHEGEIIRMADGAILRQLPQGTQVIPRLESQNLMKWAQMDPNKWTHEGINLEVVKSTPNQEINPVLNYSPTINGTGLNEQQVLDLLKKDREAAFRDFTNRIRKDLRMSGR